jgi:hypothetical protein
MGLDLIRQKSQEVGNLRGRYSAEVEEASYPKEDLTQGWCCLMSD